MQGTMELQRQEHRDIHQQMQISQAKLREHFESIKGTAENLKYYFGNVQQKEDETELLRQKYYDMLATARDEKDMYVQESQKLAYKCSTYVVYSYQHSEQREKFMATMLQDVDNYYVECENMKKDRARLTNHCGNLQKELQECHETMAQLERELSKLKEQNSFLSEKCDQYELKQQGLLQEKSNLEKTKANLDSTVANMSKKNKDLTSDLSESRNEATSLNKELNHCQDNISIMNKDIDRRRTQQEKADEKIAQQTANIGSLEKHSSELGKKCKLLSQELSKTKGELAKVKTQCDRYQETTRKALYDSNRMKEACERMRRDKDHMEEQYGSMKHERELVGKEKDRMVSREYRIKKRNQELTDDHKSLTKLVDELREKYRRADERARKDGSLKQELRDTIKRLHKEIEEEKRKHNKPVRHAGIQTDPRLACDSRDIAIQHAQFKMKQALKARDQYAVEGKRIKEMHERSLAALNKKTNELGSFEVKLKLAQENCFKMEEKFTRVEKLLNSTKAELEKEKALKMKMQQQNATEAERRLVLIEQVHLPSETKETGTQTVEDVLVNAKEAELTLNLALCLQQKVEANKAELAQRLKELDISKLKVTRLEKVIEQQKAQNETLQRKIIYIEGKFQKDRDYMRTVHNVLSPENLRIPRIGKVGVA